jgi:hypothetical protein
VTKRSERVKVCRWCARMARRQPDGTWPAVCETCGMELWHEVVTEVGVRRNSEEAEP